MIDESKKDRSQREYPHGSGDRNVWSPFGKDRMPMHRGGTQRDPVSESKDDSMTDVGTPSAEKGASHDR